MPKPKLFRALFGDAILSILALPAITAFAQTPGFDDFERAEARTSFFSAELNEFYLAVPQRGNQEAEIRVFRAQ